MEGRSLAEDRVEVLSPEGRLPQEMSDRIFVLQVRDSQAISFIDLLTLINESIVNMYILSLTLIH